MEGEIGGRAKMLAAHRAPSSHAEYLSHNLVIYARPALVLALAGRTYDEVLSRRIRCKWCGEVRTAEGPLADTISSSSGPPFGGQQVHPGCPDPRGRGDE